MSNSKITINIEKAEQVSHDLSDLLCWWQGFETAMKLNNEDFDPIAHYGIKAARNINLKIKDELNRVKGL